MGQNSVFSKVNYRSTMWTEICLTHQIHLVQLSLLITFHTKWFQTGYILSGLKVFAHAFTLYLKCCCSDWFLLIIFALLKYNFFRNFYPTPLIQKLLFFYNVSHTLFLFITTCICICCFIHLVSQSGKQDSSGLFTCKSDILCIVGVQFIFFKWMNEWLNILSSSDHIIILQYSFIICIFFVWTP